MAGTLRYRRGRWEAQVYVGRDERGKRRHLTRTLKADDNRTGRRQAEKILAGLVVEADQRRDEILHPAPVDATATVAQLLNLWYSRPGWLTGRPSRPSRLARTSTVTSSRRIGHRRLSEVRPEEIERMYRRLAENGGRGGGPLKSSSVRRVHTTLAQRRSLRRRSGGRSRRTRCAGSHLHRRGSAR